MKESEQAHFEEHIILVLKTVRVEDYIGIKQFANFIFNYYHSILLSQCTKSVLHTQSKQKPSGITRNQQLPQWLRSNLILQTFSFLASCNVHNTSRSQLRISLLSILSSLMSQSTTYDVVSRTRQTSQYHTCST